MRSGYKRSKKGCRNCKNRRIRCDELRPACRRCLIRGLTCGGYLDNANVQDYFAEAIVPAPRGIIHQVHGAALRDIIDLVPLTGNLISQTSVGAVPPAMLDFLMTPGNHIASYLQFIPSRFGIEPALDSAVICLSSALRLIYAPMISDNEAHLSHIAFLQYSNALRDLRKALSDPRRSKSTETFCATGMLCIFECATRENEYNNVPIAHVRGGKEITLHRGPNMFTSELDKDIFTLTIPSFVSEDFFQGIPCFLDNPNWMKLLRSSILESDKIAHRSRLSISLYEILIPITTLISKCTALVMSTDEMEDNTTLQHDSLVHGLEKKRLALQFWYNVWKQYLIDVSSDTLTLDEDPMLSVRLEISIVYYSFSLVVNRCFVALDGDDAAIVEQESQILAANLISYHECLTKFLPNIARLINLSSAHMILETAAAWNSFSHGQFLEETMGKSRRRRIDADTYNTGVKSMKGLR